MIDPSQVREGMMVRGSDGTAWGRVLACEDESFVVEEMLFGADYSVRYEDVTDVSGDEIRLSVTRDSFLSDPVARAEAEEDERAEENEEEEGARPLRMRGHEYPGALPPSFGEEGGGGL